MKRGYIPLEMTPWKSMMVKELGEGMDVKGPGVGFLVVYETREEALEVFPDAHVVVIEYDGPLTEEEDG